MEYGVGAESEDEEEEEGNVKVKIMKVGGDMSEMMDNILGHGGPKVM